MAQKTEKEETEFKVPETIVPCVNNCGFTGNPATNNMCQNCFTIITPSHKIRWSGSSGSSGYADCSDPVKIRLDLTILKPGKPFASKIGVNRCSGCRRKVGLTGFRCRCGDLFCSDHRYSDRHDCSFDYKTAAREAIARENPVVKAAKIVRV